MQPHLKTRHEQVTHGSRLVLENRSQPTAQEPRRVYFRWQIRCFSRHGLEPFSGWCLHALKANGQRSLLTEDAGQSQTSHILVIEFRMPLRIPDTHGGGPLRICLIFSLSGLTTNISALRGCAALNSYVEPCRVAI